MRIGLAMVTGALIGAGLLVVDSVFEIPLLSAVGLDYPITIIGGTILAAVFVILTRSDWFENLVGIRNIDILPDAFRWASYSLLALGLLLLLNNLSPALAQATGLPFNSVSIAAGTFVASAIKVVQEVITGST